MNPWSGLDLVNDNDNNPDLNHFCFLHFCFFSIPRYPHSISHFSTEPGGLQAPRQPGSPAPDTAHAKQTLSRASPLSLLSATGPVCLYMCKPCELRPSPHPAQHIYLIERDLYKKFQMYCLSGSPLIEKGISSKTKKISLYQPTAGNLVNVDNIRF